MKDSSLPYRVIPGSPPELVVFDDPQPCPYVDGYTARLPLRIPARSLTGEELDERLALGDRRQGIFFYRTECGACRACEPIRIDVQRFEPNRSQRRTLARNDALLRVESGPPSVDPERVQLYNRHKEGRGLGSPRHPIDVDGYREFLVASSCQSFELRYYLQDRLVGVAIADRGANALSAVYCYYDPAFERLGLGTYSILKEIELCRAWGLRHLYLGLYIAECATMLYKARFFPHERLLSGSWREFASGSRE